MGEGEFSLESTGSMIVWTLTSPSPHAHPHPHILTSTLTLTLTLKSQVTSGQSKQIIISEEKLFSIEKKYVKKVGKKIEHKQKENYRRLMIVMVN